MKKLILTVAVAAGTVATSFSQGLVNFNNSSAAASKISTNSIVGGASSGLTAAVANNYYFALFYSAAATSVNGASAATVGSTALNGYAFSDNNWTFATTAGNAASAGRLSGPTAFAINGVVGGNTAQFVIIGWSANIGTDVAQLQAYLANPTFNGWVGQSGVSGAISLGNGGTLPTPAVMAGAAPAITGFTLGMISPVPEPGTMALAALGGASLLLFRRRK